MVMVLDFNDWIIFTHENYNRSCWIKLRIMDTTKKGRFLKNKYQKIFKLNWNGNRFANVKDLYLMKERFPDEYERLVDFLRIHLPPPLIQWNYPLPIIDQSEV